MNKKYIAFAVAATLFASQSIADHHRPGSFNDYGRVISSTPIYETVEVTYPEEQCWDARVVHRRHGQSPAGTIAGGIIGGVIGNQFGRGSGKAAMTVAGTLLGAAIAHDATRDRHVGQRVSYERRCEVVDRYGTEERLVGYRVEYRYKGETFVTRTDEEPGRRIPVIVSVKPARHL